MTERPKTVAGLCEFYYDRFKPIYNHVQLLNKPPIGMFLKSMPRLTICHAIGNTVNRSRKSLIALAGT